MARCTIHHYNFTVRLKMPGSAEWKVKLYFAEVKEVFGRKKNTIYTAHWNQTKTVIYIKDE